MSSRITLFTLLVVVLNIFYNQTLPIYVDESYYWYWSKQLQLSYYDHPPMIAYLNYLSTSFFGDNVFAVRFASIFTLVVGGFYVYKLTLEVFKEKAIAELSMLIYLIIPIIELGMSIATIDSPLVMFWAMALYYALLALRSDRLTYFVFAGIGIGLALLSKYTAVLLFGSLGLYLLFKEPKRFLSYKPWTTILTAVIVFSPVIIWNAQNDFISFGYQYQHGSDSTFHIRWDKFFDFLGGQFVVMSPVFMLAGIVLLFKNRAWFKDREKFFLLINFLFPLLFFLYKGLFKKMELNWAAPAYLTLIPLLAAYFYERRLKKLFLFGAALSLLMVLAMKLPLAFGLTGDKNFQNRLFGPAEITQVVEKYRKTDDLIMANHLGLASTLTFYLKGHPEAHVPLESKFSQYSLWDKDFDYGNKEGLYVDNGKADAKLQKLFKHVELIEKVTLQKEGFNPKSYYLYRVSNR